MCKTRRGQKVTQLHGSYMMIMKLLLMMMIMIVQKVCVASTAQIYNLLTVNLMKIYWIEHFTLSRFVYQNILYWTLYFFSFCLSKYTALNTLICLVLFIKIYFIERFTFSRLFIKIYCIEHFILFRFGYQNTNFQKTFRSSTSGRNRKLRSWVD